MKKMIICAVFALLSMTALTGCSTNHYSGSEYKNDQAMQRFDAYMAKVVSVRKVKINGLNTGLGILGGGAAGAAAGSLIGGGSGQIVSSVLVGLAGAIAGGLTESNMAENDALEIVVMFADGKMMGITQANDIIVKKGDIVNVLVGGDDIRVSPMM